MKQNNQYEAAEIISNPTENNETRSSNHEDTKELQRRLVQCCIDFINERKLNDITRVDFNADMLQASAKAGKWLPYTDSYCGTEGLNENGFYEIDKSY